MEIKKFNFFEEYGEAIQDIKDLKYILEDEGIGISINGPASVLRNVYFDKSPSFIFISVYKSGWDTYDIRGSEDFREFYSRLQDEIGEKFNVGLSNDGNLLYLVIEIVSKKQQDPRIIKGDRKFRWLV